MLMIRSPLIVLPGTVSGSSPHEEMTWPCCLQVCCSSCHNRPCCKALLMLLDDCGTCLGGHAPPSKPEKQGARPEDLFIALAEQRY